MDKQDLNEMNIDDEKITNAFFDVFWANIDKFSDDEAAQISESYIAVMAVLAKN